MCRSLQRATVQRRPAYAAMHDLCMICAACRPARAARVRSEVNSELNFPPNFEGLVLGCIDA